MISQEEHNLFVYFAALAIIFFTSRFISSNAVKRGMSRLWGLLALLGVLPGLVIYLIIRKPLNENSNLTSKNETYDGLKSDTLLSQLKIIQPLVLHSKPTSCSIELTLVSRRRVLCSIFVFSPIRC